MGRSRTWASQSPRPGRPVKGDPEQFVHDLGSVRLTPVPSGGHQFRPAVTVMRGLAIPFILFVPGGLLAPGGQPLPYSVRTDVVSEPSRMPMIPKAAEAIVTCSHPADPGDLDAAERFAASACGPRSTGPQLSSILSELIQSSFR
jgi:hypothetical protein